MRYLHSCDKCEKLLKIFQNCKWETRSEKLKIKACNVLLHISWIYYNCHIIILLRSFYSALGADSDSNGCHPYHGWQYFAGRFSFRFRSRLQHLLIYRELSCFLYLSWWLDYDVSLFILNKQYFLSDVIFFNI